MQPTVNVSSRRVEKFIVMSYISQKPYRYLERNHSSSNTILAEPVFEFEESDIWDSPSAERTKKSAILPTSRSSKKLVKKKTSTDGVARSLPVNIPDWSKMRYDEGDREDDQDGDDEVRQPPHEYLLARETLRNQDQIACSFSVHEGRGRTLKGRDLRRVRNAIWEQTGFQD